MLRILNVLLNEGFLSLLKKVVGKLSSYKFKKYMAAEYWLKAILIGEKLVEVFPHNRIYHMNLAYCYQNIDEHEKANKIIEKCLRLNFNLSWVMHLSEKSLPEVKFIDSKYLDLGGDNNEGIIEHSVNSKKYITKIIQSSKHKEVEMFFYKKIYDRYSHIREITPKLIHIREINDNNLLLITMEKIEGYQPNNIDDKTIHDVANLTKIISSIKYGDIYKWYPIVVKKHNHKLYNLLWSFSHIHITSRNIENFKYLYNEIKRSNYSNKTTNLIRRLEYLILELELYRLISPFKHYTTQHGDFFHWNLIRDSNTNKLYLIDWGEMRIGPSWCDMAGFLGEIKYPFHKVKSNYLMNDQLTGHLEPIEKIFFIYTLIMVWFNEFSKKEFEKEIESYLLPAIKEIEKLSSSIDYATNDIESSLIYP